MLKNSNPKVVQLQMDKQSQILEDTEGATLESFMGRNSTVKKKENVTEMTCWIT